MIQHIRTELQTNFVYILDPTNLEEHKGVPGSLTIVLDSNMFPVAAFLRDWQDPEISIVSLSRDITPDKVPFKYKSFRYLDLDSDLQLVS
jgi:hypothetical protein